MSFEGPNDEKPAAEKWEDEIKLNGLDSGSAGELGGDEPVTESSSMRYTRRNPYKSRAAARIVRRRVYLSLLFAGTIIFGLLLGAGGYWALHIREKPAAEAGPQTAGLTNPAGSEAKNGLLCPLCGLPLEKLPANRPLAVMIDNLNLARPQSGLEQADLVYEAPVEGGITRLMPVFYHQKPGKIGPIRSARPYFISMAQENQAVYIHCGGSDEALQTLAGKSIASVNEISLPKYFWRSPQRPEPRNLYSSSEQLELAAKERGINLGAKTSARQFIKDDTALGGGITAETVTLSYGVQSNEVKYVYNAADKVYRRFNGGQQHVDADSGRQLTAANVVVQYVGGRVLDGEGRLQLGIIGSGKAAVYIRGQKIDATWSKSAADSRTVFKNQQGAEIAFAPGTTWIQLATPNVRVY